jgi:hypothetical protein
MANVREQSERLAAARRAEIEENQKIVIAHVAQKDGLEKLKTAQEDDTHQTDDATSAKTKLRQVAQGLSVEFPALAQLTRLLSSEEALLAGSVALAVHAFYAYYQELKKSEDAQADLTTSSGELGQSILTALRFQADAEAALEEAASAAGAAAAAAASDAPQPGAHAGGGGGHGAAALHGRAEAMGTDAAHGGAAVAAPGGLAAAPLGAACNGHAGGGEPRAGAERARDSVRLGPEFSQASQ